MVAATPRGGSDIAPGATVGAGRRSCTATLHAQYFPRPCRGRCPCSVSGLLADGRRIRFEPVSSGKTHFDAIFEHKASPTEFYGALLQWNGQGWNIDLRDGGRYLFGACTPHGKDVCHIVGHRDARGVETVLQHDAAGDVTRISSGDGWIALSYDASHHIIDARSSRGETVKYEYDVGGHLVRVARSDGRLQEY